MKGAATSSAWPNNDSDAKASHRGARSSKSSRTSRRLDFKNGGRLLWDTVNAGISGDFLTQGAALAYYTVFAIAPLFVIALAIAGFCFGAEAAHRELFGQLNQLLGNEGGKALEAMVAAANKSRSGFWATVVAGVTLVIAATGVFV